MSINILRLSAVMAKTGLPRSTIYLCMNEDDFPKPIPLSNKSTRAVGWVESEINAWLEQCIESRHKQPAQSL